MVAPTSGLCLHDTELVAKSTHPEVLVNPEVPAKTLKEFIALLKSKPGQLAFGSSGVGSPPHLTGAMFQKATGTPERIIRKIRDAVVKAIDTPEEQQRAASLGVEMQGSTPDWLRDYTKSELIKWGEVVRESGVKPE